MAETTKTADKRGSPKSGAAKSEGARSAQKAAVPHEETPTTAPVTRPGSRVEAFRELADAYADGACVMLPEMLTGQARREHVRATLREDHQERIAQNAEGTEAKFDKLSRSLFTFFRGSALLYYRDMAGVDSRMPSVLVLGDVHPENFGIMPNADNVPIFSVNDFDDVFYAPFTWDLKRGATGFMLASEEIGGHKPKTQASIVEAFVKGYLDDMHRIAEHTVDMGEEYRMDNSPKVLRRLFQQADRSREKWLKKRYLDETGRGFQANKKLTPVSTRRDEFQKIVNQLVKGNGIDVPARAADLRVKDVAIRHGQGTSSLGLPRYYVLIEGRAKDGTDDLVIEFKRARRSALVGLVPPSDFDPGEKGQRIAHGQSVHLANGDVFYGSADIDGMSFMSRERAPFRDDIDLDDLSKKSWHEYADVCGRALAQAHGRSDEAGEIDYDIEPEIVAAAHPEALFVDDVQCHAREASERLRRDHKAFKTDHALGAFTNIEMHYR